MEFIDLKTQIERPTPQSPPYAANEQHKLSVFLNPETSGEGRLSVPLRPLRLIKRT
jgi:hypothetical protein